jgi:hypothetical protein
VSVAAASSVSGISVRLVAVFMGEALADPLEGALSPGFVRIAGWT